MSSRLTCLLVLCVSFSLTLPTSVKAEVAPTRVTRSRTEIRAEIRTLQLEDRSLPGPDRTLEVGIGIAALLTGTAFLVGDLAYVLGNVPLWCGVGPMGGGCGAPTNGVDDDLTLGLGIAGGLLLATGVISFIVGFTRRPDEQTRERRHEIREQIRRDVIELRLAGSGLRLTF